MLVNKQKQDLKSQFLSWVLIDNPIFAKKSRSRGVNPYSETKIFMNIFFRCAFIFSFLPVIKSLNEDGEAEQMRKTRLCLLDNHINLVSGVQ